MFIACINFLENSPLTFWPISQEIFTLWRLYLFLKFSNQPLLAVNSLSLLLSPEDVKCLYNSNAFSRVINLLKGTLFCVCYSIHIFRAFSVFSTLLFRGMQDTLTLALVPLSALVLIDDSLFLIVLIC